MSACGLSYGQTKVGLATVVENGVCDDDPRVLPRVNEAIHALMHLRDPQSGLAIIPVGTMATYDVTAVGTILLLPKELENAIEVEVLTGRVNNQTDVTQGWYNLVNPFTYVDPAGINDNPLVDLFLVPDEIDPTILRRKYDYPGLAENSVVRVTGAKRFIPMTQDSDCLLIQNIRAVKLMIQAIDREENNAFEQSNALIQRATEMLLAEIKGHQLDPRNMAKRKAAYERDLVTYNDGTLGYIRARLAFELSGGHNLGKSELTRVIEQAEMRIMDKGHPVGTIEEFHACVQDGYILLPARVKSVLAAGKNGAPMDIRSMFFKYQQNGPGAFGPCGLLQDEGEVRLQDGQMRRKFRLT